MKGQNKLLPDLESLTKNQLYLAQFNAESKFEPKDIVKVYELTELGPKMYTHGFSSIKENMPLSLALEIQNNPLIIEDLANWYRLKAAEVIFKSEWERRDKLRRM